MKQNLSLVVLTWNEELHLERCLQSVRGVADQIIVVDSGSTDKTLEIARASGAEVYSHPFKNQAEQFNWALDNTDIKGDWILRLDADEYLTPELGKEIAAMLENPPEAIAGFYIKRKVYFWGRWIRHGGYYPRWFLRLWRKGAARSEEREMDEHIVLEKGNAGKLKADFVDENLQSLEWWTDKHNKFSSREVDAIMHAGEKLSVEKNVFGSQAERKRWAKDNFYMKLPAFLRALLYFKWRYFIRLGFLDGIPGLVFHLLQGFWYRFLIDAKLKERKRTASQKRFPVV